MRLISKRRTGLFRGVTRVEPPSYLVRATIPVIEALQRTANQVELVASPHDPLYVVTLLGKVPPGISACHVNGPPHVDACLRFWDEPKYPEGHWDYWLQVDWTPCPICGSPVVWYEAGYVPGYRVCTRPPHHHSCAK